MTDTIDKIEARGCTAPARRRWAVHALGAALLAAFITCGEVRLIEQASAIAMSCGISAPNNLVRIVDSSLASGFAPIANLH